MKQKLKGILKLLFFLGLAIFLIWFVVKDLTEEDKKNVKEAFSKADYFWIILAMTLGGISHWSRAVRWKILLEPLNHKPTTSNTFFAVMVGYLANLAFPRLGEVSRCGVLTKYEKIPFTEGFGTVIAERVIDMICLIAVFFITLATQFEKIYAHADEKIISPLSEKLSGLLHNSKLLGAGVFFLLIVFALIFFMRKKLKGVLFEKIKAAFLGFWEGIKTVQKIKKPGWFFVHTILIWFLYYFQLHIAFHCFGETSSLGAKEALAVLMFGSIAIIFIPGGTGAYQLLVIDTLMKIYFVSYTISFAFAWLVWTSQIVLILTLGVISLILLPIFNKSKQ